MSTSAVTIDFDDREHFAAALEDLRRARRRNRIAHIDKFDAFYKAYLIGIFGSLFLYGLAGQVGDEPLTTSALTQLRIEGPSYLAPLVALAFAIGLRSGGRGGPLAFERADVRHVLLSPVDRRDSIRRPAFRQLRHSAFLGAVAGAAAGIIALRRLPGVPVNWIVCGAVFGGAVAVGGYSIAMVAGGQRWHRWITDVLGGLLLGWSAADAFWHLQTSPFSWLGTVALWPMHFNPLGLAGIAVIAGLAAWGLLSVNAGSIEAAERRSRLVGQLRFAATLQDVRTVMLLQRQLSQERVRDRPWIRLPRGKRFLNAKGNPRKRVFLRRSLHGWLRWPLFRILRLFALAIAAGFAVCGVWTGNTFLIVVAGLCLWLMALDLLEPLAQETDHLDRAASVGYPLGWIKVRLLLAPIFAMIVLVLVGALPAVLLGPSEVTAALLPPLVLSAAVLAVGGAALVVNRSASPPMGSMSNPEVAGIQAAWKLLVPPGLAVAGLVPLIPAREAWFDSHLSENMLVAMNLPWYAVLAFGSWAIAWVRYGDEMRESLRPDGNRNVSGKAEEKKDLKPETKTRTNSKAKKNVSGSKKTKKK